MRNEIADKAQLRASLLRWALLLAPGILLLGMLSGTMGGSGAGNPWFAALAKPSLYPPPAVFGMVWSALYVLMGVAAAMIVVARGAKNRQVALILFAVQLALNLAWSPLFFGAHQIFGAFVLIGVLDAVLLVTVWLFYTVRPLAAALLLPYLLWALFATALTWQFHEANPNADGQETSGAVTRVQI